MGTTEQQTKIASLQQEISAKDKALYEKEQAIEQNEKELQMLQKDLVDVKDQRQFSKEYMGLLMKEKQLQQIQLATLREERRKLEPNNVQKRAGIAHKIEALEHKLRDFVLESERSNELDKHDHVISDRIDAITHNLEELHSSKWEMQVGLMKCEQDLNACLLEGNVPPVPLQKEVSYIRNCS